MRRKAICRKCGKEIQEVAPDRWGHTVNPGVAAHRPIIKIGSIEGVLVDKSS